MSRDGPKLLGALCSWRSFSGVLCATARQFEGREGQTQQAQQGLAMALEGLQPPQGSFHKCHKAPAVLQFASWGWESKGLLDVPCS